jgi:PAS domain S-box-containing protein
MEQLRKTELEATHQRIKFFETLLHASTDGIVITNPTQNIIVVNEVFCTFFDRHQSEVAETNLFVWLGQFDVDAPQRWAKLEQRVRTTGSCRDIEFWRQVQHEIRYFSVNASLLERVADEEVGLIISIWRDITEHKRAEEEVRRYEEHLEELVVERTAELKEMNAGLQQEITARKRAEEALQCRIEELSTLQATVLDITAPHDLSTLLQTIVERAARLLNTLGGGLYLCDPSQEHVRCVVSYNTPRDYSGTVLKYGEGAAGTVAQTGEPLIIDDYRTWSRRASVYEEEQPFTAVLSVPMIWQGQITGVIHVLDNVESRRFTQADLKLLTLFANHAAIAVEHTQLHDHAQKEISERKRAEEKLRQSMVELEQFNRLAVGREHRIIELKRAMNELSQKLGQAPPYDLARVDDFEMESRQADETRAGDKETLHVQRLTGEGRRYELVELLDLDQMQRLLDSFCDAVGIAAGLTDLQGNALIGARWERICNDFHRVHARTFERCLESDTELANLVKMGERFTIYQCRNGLTDAAAPISIAGEHVANAFVGQFLLEPPDEDFFRRQAAEYGFNERDYLEALSNVPVVPQAKFPAILRFLASFAELVATIGLERMQEREAEARLARYAEELAVRNQELQRQRQAAMNLAQDAEEARIATEQAEEEIQQLNAELEDRVRQRTAEVEAANKELRDFVYAASHDLKTQVRGISQLAQWLVQDYAKVFDAEGHKLVTMLINRAKRLDALINGILEYSQVGRIVRKEAEVNLHELVKEVIDRLAPPEHIRVAIAHKLPVIIGDKTRLTQVFRNLVENAVKFLDKPQGEVKIGCVDQGDCWQFSIADNGPGIDPKYHKKIFQIFRTLASRDEREDIGIGLALVKRIVELYGGKIWVESAIGQGSTFFFTFPKKS